MPTQTVTFEFITGLRRAIFRNARLLGSWDANGRLSDTWTESPMTEAIGEDGCPIFRGSVDLDLADSNREFRWGVVLDGPQGNNFWGVPTETQDIKSAERHRQFRLNADADAALQRYYFTYNRYLGANRLLAAENATSKLRFAVWAPNAKQVEVIFGTSDNGYIDNAGAGVDPTRPVVSLTKGLSGIWEGTPPGNFDDFKSVPYMYRIKTAQGETKYRTDIFSRSQIGKGATNPRGAAYAGAPDDLDGSVSCSVVIDPDVVRSTFESTRPGEHPPLIPAEEFWSTEFELGLPVPSRVEDLVVYELHVNSLGFGRADSGNLADAIVFLDHLVDLGINTVELMPMAEFSGSAGWGYGDTHHFCIESSAGGRDKYRHFVRACHQRGIAVIQDVVYNHYDNEAERAQWQYDSTDPQQNIFYWYEGEPGDYQFPDGGYLDNGSSGATPRLWEEIVRQQFISSAAFLIEEMHVDGLRVDLTQAIHRDNQLHADGTSIGSANIFGQKLLREWSRTLHMIKPTVMLVAEDHTGWDAVTKLPAQGGLGFDATWQLAFYHNLIGDSDMAGGRARVLKQAGFGGNGPLSMDVLSGSMYDTQYRRVVFHESHDEAGNALGTARTMVVAVNGAPIIGATRAAAEARSRVCFGLSLLSAGTPMFFMGEEIGAQQLYDVFNFKEHREDIIGERGGNGRLMFRFYQDVITLSKRLRSIRSHNIDILHQSNQARVIAFKRWSADEQVIIIASFNNSAFSNGYLIQKDFLAIPDANWKETFNSDASIYGGSNVGNFGAIVPSAHKGLYVVVPANGFLVFVKQ
ncbi:MAG: alpha amylase C-terminal domain-containing protein [Rhodospirillales bacterium]|nr:alpha amylase C-terminal domain-containing protein [Rhodospirillales bacterium]